MGKTTNILDLNNRLTKVEKENVTQNSYTSLKNKPKINNVTLTGNKSLADIGAAAAADLTTLAGDVGNKTNLTTTNKDDLVSAINEVNSGLNDVTNVTVTTEHQSITTSTVYAKKLGKILLVSGYFYIASGQDILKDVQLFTVNQSIVGDVFTSLVSSGGDVARLKMATDGKIYTEYTFKNDSFYSFELVAITN